jgi:hypothetical protein
MKPLTAGLVVFASVLAGLGSPAPRAQSPAIEANEVVLRAIDAPVVAGAWTRTAIAGASASTAPWQPDAGVPKIATASATPQHNFELSFTAAAGVPYRLWVRARAANDAYTNDSVFVQFSGSTTSTGAPVFRIGSTDATVYSLEDCNGCGESAWGWQDNSYGGFGSDIYFPTTEAQRLRIQTREDGLSIDQVVLSPRTYLKSRPGAAKNDTTILPSSGGS